MKLTPRVNFINVFQAAFTCADPKCAKRHSSHQCLLAILGPTHVKCWWNWHLYLKYHKKCKVIITIKYYLLSSPFATCDEFSLDSNLQALWANILRRDLPRNRSTQCSCQDRSRLGIEEVFLRDRRRIA